MTPEQGPSAEDLYNEHKKLVGSKPDREEWLQKASEELVKARNGEIVATPATVNEATRHDAPDVVEDREAEVEMARNNLAAVDRRYDANIAAGAETTAEETFVDEALAEDKARPTENI